MENMQKPEKPERNELEAYLKRKLRYYIQEAKKAFYILLTVIVLIAILALAGYCKVESTKNLAKIYEAIGL